MNTPQSCRAARRGHPWILSLIAAVVLLGGCSLKQEAPPVSEKVEQVEKQAAEFDIRQQERAARPTIVDHSGIYISSGQSVTLPRQEQLPNVFATETPMKLRGSLREFASVITSRRGIDVQLSPELTSIADTDDGSGFQDSTGGANQPGGDDDDDFILPGGSGGEQGRLIAEEVRTISHNGSLKELLDALASAYGISWSWRGEDGVVELHRFVSHTYTIASLAGTVTNETDISNDTSSTSGGDSDGGSSSRANLTSEVEFERSTWDEVQTGVTNLLSSRGSSSVNRTAGTITVTDEATVQNRVGQFIKGLNRRLSRQVMVDVRVYSLDLSDSKATNFDLSSVIRGLDDDLRINFEAPDVSGGLLDAGSVSTAILSPDELSDPGSLSDNFGGTEWLLQALKDQGDVSVVSSVSGVTMSGRALPMNDVIKRNFVENTSTSQTIDVGTQTDIETATLTTGLSMRVRPVVLDNGRILMRSQLTLTELRRLRRIEQGNTVIEAPDRRQRSSVATATMPSQSTLVVANIQRDRNEDNERIGLAGLSKNKASNRSVVLVTLTISRIGGADLDGTNVSHNGTRQGPPSAGLASGVPEAA